MEDEILYLCKRKIDGTILYLLVAPGELRKDALRLIHEKESGHLGHHKTVIKCEDYFYWPNLRNDVKNYVKSCVSYQQLKTSRGLQQQWQELPPVNQPMEGVSIDITHMGSATTSHRYVLTVLDHFSRFVNFYPKSTRTAESVVSKLDVVTESYGNPRVLLTDNAREFCSVVLRNWCRENGVKLVHCTPYHPQGNSVCERMHRTMKVILATLCKGHPARWPRYIKKCQKIINNAVHESTGEQPYFLMFRRRHPRMIGVEYPQLVQDADLDMAIEVVKQSNLQQARKWRDRANRGRQNQWVEKGQLVWVKKDYVTSLGDRKLGLKWVGPYKIKEVLREGGAYKLEDVFEGVVIQRAADKVKPYVGQVNILTQPREVFYQEDSEEEDERRPVRNRVPPRRNIEEDDSQQISERGEMAGDEESELAAGLARPRRQRRPVRRYIKEME